MLGSKFLSVRLGGIYALQRLVEEYPEEYHVQVMGILCAFVRHPTEDTKHEYLVGSRPWDPNIRDDVQAVVKIIGKRTTRDIELEEKKETYPDLRNTNLTNAFLADMNLRNVQFSNASLAGAFFNKSDLTKTYFYKTNLTNAMLNDANVSGAIFSGEVMAETFGEKVSKCDLRRFDVRGLTQNQLDQARAWSDEPPRLDDVKDAEGNDLIWRGGRGAPLQ